MRTKQNRRLRANEQGYTLIELLLYVAIVGVLLAAVTTFFGSTVDARVKNQTINEVNEQATQLMDSITQTVHNATSISSPAAGASGSSLTLVVPTGSLSPTVFDISGGGSTVLGYNADGGNTDTGDSNSIDATKFTASASGTISTLYALIGPTVAASPNNKGQMAIYSGTTPTTLLASSSDTTLTANAWNAFAISSISVTSGQTYWLAYNTNGTSSTQNNVRYAVGTSGQERFVGQTYGAWPSSFTGNTGTNQMSVYANIVSGGSTGAAEVKEGANAAVALTNSQVQLTNLTFTNLTRGGTNGSVQVSFTITHVNPAGRNEYDYQQTYKTTAEVGW